MPSMAPYIVGAAISALFASGSGAVSASQQSATWAPTPQANAAANTASIDLATKIAPAEDEASYDAISMLQTGMQSSVTPPPAAPSSRLPPADLVGITYRTFVDVTGPMDNGTAEIRRLHNDALGRLRDWNATVVKLSNPTNASIESMIVTARLSLIRDFALVSGQTEYRTIRDAIVDLDFVMAVYDEEEMVATQRCDDALVTAIRKARADAASLILSQNISLPGIATTEVNGVWPSLVVAHKLYFDGKRHVEVENYNPSMIPFWMGRDVVAPAA
jgi:hypothetical protein